MADRTLSDVIAERVIQLRKEAGLTRREFVARCQEMAGSASGDFSVGAMANIETGRRTKDGVRRRKVEAEEATVFAAVFKVPLVWLMTDARSTEPTPLYGDVEANPWRALGWLTGAWPLDKPSPGSAWSEAASHLARLHDVYEQIEHYDFIRRLYAQADPPVGLSEEESKRQGLSAILDRLDAFRFGGMPMPPVPEHIHEGIAELLVDRVRKRLEEPQGLRALADEWIPADDKEQARRRWAADTADAKALRRLAESLRQLHNFGQPLPAIPDEVLARAKELDVNLTPWREAQ